MSNDAMQWESFCIYLKQLAEAVRKCLQARLKFKPIFLLHFYLIRSEAANCSRLWENERR